MQWRRLMGDKAKRSDLPVPEGFASFLKATKLGEGGRWQQVVRHYGRGARIGHLAQTSPISSHTLLRALGAYTNPAVRSTLQTAFAAYGVFQQGEQHGITLGGVLQGAITGYEVGGPVGALVGAGLDILGGLFHHSHLPPVASQNLAQQFGPGGFDYLAYRYHYFHTLGPVGSLLGPLPATSYRLATQFFQPAPQIHLYIDGVKTAVNAQLQKSAGLDAAANANVYYNAARPL
ncbi:hypothetical protein CWRG_01664 [Chthonomonas calidirosea]|uniref:hypothetical protein n=1 Tax=Chthonomonas calidirosea TaxID=454171 RepID=UPI0006DD4E74|nr:hypothetical protein [Chthonomonas calidirosea]CEK16928.1 hypothetical protein CWRG_01664 [Chthonomonas calidirosea]